MDPTVYELYQSDKRYQSSLREIVEPDDSANIYKMRLPSHQDIVPPRNNFLDYIKVRENIGFQLLPLFDVEVNKLKLQTKYEFAVKDLLAIQWNNYQAQYTMSPAAPVLPSAKDVRSDCQKVSCPDCTAKRSGKRMTEGANLDATGPVPVPADVHRRYRAKLAMIKSQRSKKPFK